MENNNLTLRTSMNENDWSKLISRLNVTDHLSKGSVFNKLAALYTSVLEKTVSPVQAVHFFYAQLAALGLFLPIEMGLGWRACFMLILCNAVRNVFADKQ